VLEEACLARFGTLRPAGTTSVIRRDNGLVFQSRRFRAACREYRLPQEFITLRISVIVTSQIAAS
jgi:putative transposase